MKPRPFAQRFIAYLCCWLLNVPFLAQAHTMGPNGPVVEPVPVERSRIDIPRTENRTVPDRTRRVERPTPAPQPAVRPDNSSTESRLPRLPDRPAIEPESGPEPVERETTSAPSVRTDSTPETENSVPENIPVAGNAGDDGGTTEMFFIHTDHLNTPRVVTDEQQKKIWEWENTDPFGNNAPDENPEGQGNFAFNLRFPGQYHDMETGLHYNFHRDYDPGIGRYVQSDPIGLMGGLNTYGYVGGNPLMYADPSGKIPPLLGLLGGLVIRQVVKQLLKSIARLSAVFTYNFAVEFFDKEGDKHRMCKSLISASVATFFFVLSKNLNTIKSLGADMSEDFFSQILGNFCDDDPCDNINISDIAKTTITSFIDNKVPGYSIGVDILGDPLDNYIPDVIVPVPWLQLL